MKINDRFCNDNILELNDDTFTGVIIISKNDNNEAELLYKGTLKESFNVVNNIAKKDVDISYIAIIDRHTDYIWSGAFPDGYNYKPMKIVIPNKFKMNIFNDSESLAVVKALCVLGFSIKDIYIFDTNTNEKIWGYGVK